MTRVEPIPAAAAARYSRDVFGRARGRARRRRGGRILAVKLGLNPNSSSLGADVTFLLMGAAVLSLVTPVVATLLRFRRPRDGTRRDAPARSRQHESAQASS